MQQEAQGSLPPENFVAQGAQIGGEQSGSQVGVVFNFNFQNQLQTNVSHPRMVWHLWAIWKCVEIIKVFAVIVDVKTPIM